MQQVFSERKRGMRWRGAAILAFVFVVMFGWAQYAHADVVAEGPGVRGHGDWSWGVQELRSVHLSAQDLACDSNPVYVELRVTFRDGTFSDVLRRDYHGGCGTTGNWYNLYISFGARISGVTVRACVNRNFNTDLCYLSNYHDNPLT
jgi:hypothetical protein